MVVGCGGGYLRQGVMVGGELGRAPSEGHVAHLFPEAHSSPLPHLCQHSGCLLSKTAREGRVPELPSLTAVPLHLLLLTPSSVLFPPSLQPDSPPRHFKTTYNQLMWAQKVTLNDRTLGGRRWESRDLAPVSGCPPSWRVRVPPTSGGGCTVNQDPNWGHPLALNGGRTHSQPGSSFLLGS